MLDPPLLALCVYPLYLDPASARSFCGRFSAVFFFFFFFFGGGIRMRCGLLFWGGR